MDSVWKAGLVVAPPPGRAFALMRQREASKAERDMLTPREALDASKEDPLLRSEFVQYALRRTKKMEKISAKEQKFQVCFIFL